uniref:Uncharacterized protein n=1 Tax=Graphocephala atropunctata TaxID=36148 RepID=A0A1B6MNU5_9HEMI
MLGVSQLLLDVRDIGESVVSTSQDIQLLLRPGESSDIETLQKIKHAKDLLSNILSLLALFSSMDQVDIDRGEELSVEIKRIEFSCIGLQSILSQSIDSISVLQEQQKQILKFLQMINQSANRIVTISLVAKETHRHKDISEIKFQEVCYENKLTCEQHCDGNCYQDDCAESSECPENTEVFTPSPLTHIESGEKGKQHMYWHKLRITIHEKDKDVKETQPHESVMSINEVTYKLSIWDKISGSNNKVKIFTFDNKANVEHSNGNLYNSNDTLSGIQKESEVISIVMRDENNTVQELFDSRDAIDSKIHEESVNETKTAVSENTTTGYPDVESTTEFALFSSESTNSHIESSTTLINDYVLTTESTISSVEVSEHYADTTTPSYYETTTFEETTSTNEFTTETTSLYYETYSSDYSSNYDTTTECTSETPYTTEEPTTPTYETTTQDLYKFSQDIYSVAQDMSTKTNEISSMTSDISCKISNINSLMSDINSYDDEELSKKVQSVNKLTQDINSRTSEISSSCSSMSSLASDISSASSDMPSADRSNTLRTSPWQKISAKGQELVASAQAVVSASQEILLKTDAVVTSTSDMTVGPQVAAIGYDVTAKTQLVISETLGLVSAVIDVINVLDS